MTTKQDFLRTVHPDQQNEIRMDRANYERIKQFILELLDRKQELTINELISHTHLHFEKIFGENTGWYIYPVKLDPEARGLIRHERGNKKQRRSMIITMNTKPTQRQ